MKSIETAIDRGAPFIAISTVDQWATVEEIRSGNPGAAIVTWDAVQGLQTLPGKEQADEATDIVARIEETLGATTDFPAAMNELRNWAASRGQDRIRRNEVLIAVLGANRIAVSDMVQERTATLRCVQALLNARNAFKSNRVTALLLGPSFSLPVEICQDVYNVDCMLPDDEERGSIIRGVCDAADIRIHDVALRSAVIATKGLSAFSVEQAAALSVTRNALDIQLLRNHWKNIVNSQRGLNIQDNTCTLDDIAGLDEIKRFAKAIMQGKRKPGVIVRIDEIEKAMAGSATDTTGVSQDVLGQVLTFMQEDDATGLIAYGVAGSGKSMCSTALGSICGIPTINLDIGGLKEQWVGASEANVRNAIRTIRAMTGQSFWIATANSLTILPPELKRRFAYGIWFFDLPDEKEGEALWKMYTEKYGVPDDRPQDCVGWTGHEVKTCCEIADNLVITPREAATWITPVKSMATEVILEMRKQATGRYRSASYPGVYRMPKDRPLSDARQIRL